MKKSNWSILFWLLILSLGCGKDNEFDYIKTGCIPSRIVLEENILGGSDDIFIYDDNVLLAIGNNDYKYDGEGKVSEIWIGNNRYEKYHYNEMDKVSKTEQFRKDSPSESFKKTLEFEFYYSDNKIIKYKDLISNEEFDVFYNAAYTNIDTVKTFSSDGLLTELVYYKYDQSNNVYRNLTIPQLNFFWWIDKTTSNNITQKTIIRYEPNLANYVYIYSYTYNSDNFPEKIITTEINSGYTSTRTITYDNCE